MVDTRKILIVTVTLVLVFLLSACGSSTNDNESHSNNSSQGSNADLLKEDSLESASNIDNSNKDNNANKTVDTSDIDEDQSTINSGTSLKERYLNKINDIKKETKGLEATDSSTYALKKVENDRWYIWDGLLNEIYGVLKEQLPLEEMDQLREEQRNWIKYRDDSALEASRKYKGGTQEHLEYVAVLANLTEERCYELVEDYMG